MDAVRSLQDLLAGQTVSVALLPFVVNLVLGAILSSLLALLYTHHGESFSNRRAFARNFVLITLTTLLVISIVKSSLALSLGLVGALSIVRFRAAIKEPEELAYLYLAIGIGLGLGADQRVITLVAFMLIAAVMWLKQRLQRGDDGQSVYLTVTSPGPDKLPMDRMVEILKPHCTRVSLKRLDETRDVLEVSFVVAFDGLDGLNRAKAGLRQLNESVQISFLDSQGVG